MTPLYSRHARKRREAEGEPLFEAHRRDKKHPLLDKPRSAAKTSIDFKTIQPRPKLLGHGHSRRSSPKDTDSKTDRARMKTEKREGIENGTRIADGGALTV